MATTAASGGGTSRQQGGAGGLASPSDDGHGPSQVDSASSSTAGDDLMIVDSLERIPLFGLDFVNAPRLDPVVDAVLGTTPRDDDQVLPVLLTPNVDIVVHLDQAPDSVENDMFRRSQFCLPDGAPIVAVSRLFGRRLQARLPGSGLFESLWPRMVAERVPCVIVASSDEIVERLGSEHPGAAFVVPPMFDADDPAALASIADAVLAEVERIGPRLILVGIGNPKDARIMATMFDRWSDRLGPKPLCLGLGGSFIMYLGLKRRAPVWVQAVGMEWFFRFLQEPRRLFHRYFIKDSAFVGIVWREWRSRGLTLPGRRR